MPVGAGRGIDRVRQPLERAHPLARKEGLAIDGNRGAAGDEDDADFAVGEMTARDVAGIGQAMQVEPDIGPAGRLGADMVDVAGRGLRFKS